MTINYALSPRSPSAPRSSGLRLAGGALAMALMAASAAHAQTAPSDAAVRAATEGYTQFNQGNLDAAVVAARDAVEAAPEWLDYRLLLADVLLRGGRNVEAYVALAPASREQDYRVQSRLAQAAAGAGLKAEASVAYGAAAGLTTDPESRAYLTRAHIMTLLELDNADGARRAFDQAWSSGILTGHAPIDAAMLAIAVGDDEAAQTAFADAERSTGVTGRVALDAGYSARRLGRSADAARYFQRGLDDAQAGGFALSSEQSLEIRQEISLLRGN